MNNFAYIPIDFLKKERSRGELLVYCYLASCQNNKAYCFPSQASIGSQCGISPRHVRRALEVLQGEGWIITLTIGKGGKRNSYRIKSIFNHECTLYARVTLSSLVKIPTLSAQRVYITLCSFQGSKGYAYPSRVQIAEATRLNLRSVGRAVGSLCVLGLLRRISLPRGGWGHAYYTCYDAIESAQEAQVRTGTDDLPMNLGNESRSQEDTQTPPIEDLQTPSNRTHRPPPYKNIRYNINNNTRDYTSEQSKSLETSETGYIYDAYASLRPHEESKDIQERGRKEEVPEKPKPTSDLKDPLAARIEVLFLTVAPNEYISYAKERKSIYQILKYFERCNYSEEDIKSILRTFYELKYESRDDFWANTPYTPSRLLSHMSSIVTFLNKKENDSERHKSTQEALRASELSLSPAEREVRDAIERRLKKRGALS